MAVWLALLIRWLLETIRAQQGVLLYGEGVGGGGVGGTKEGGTERKGEGAIKGGEREDAYMYEAGEEL